MSRLSAKASQLTSVSNVDRLFALWQILNPSTWVEPAENTFGTYFEAPGFIDTASSGKLIFWEGNDFVAEQCCPSSTRSLPF
jgi:hypothetical protein